MRGSLSIVSLICFHLVSLPDAGAQTPPDMPPTQSPGNAPPPTKVEDRTFFPKTDIADPTELIGFFFVVTEDGGKNTLELLYKPLINKGVVPVTTFLKPTVAFKRTFSKGEGAEFSIPGIATASLKDKEVQDFTVTDVANASIAPEGFYDFCEAWRQLRNLRDWKVGDKINYIWRTQVSTISSKNGTEHQAGGEIGLGDYFSAGGSQYKQTSENTFISVVSLSYTSNQLSAQVIANGCRTGNRRLNTNNEISMHIDDYIIK